MKLLCVALCMAGIFMFYDGQAGTSIVGILLAFASGNTYAFYIMYLDKSDLRDMPSLKLIFYMNAVAAALISVVALATGELAVHLTPYGWAMGVCFAVVVSFVGVLGFQIGVKYTGGQTAAILSTFEPITSVVIGAILYQEAFTTRGAFGCIFILAATIIVTFNKENKEAEEDVENERKI